MNAPGCSPYAATSKTIASSSVATTPPIMPRIRSASRLKVRRAGFFVTRRRHSAHPTLTSTITATTFCIARVAAQSSPSSGHEITAWSRPPVTMFAVPTVSRMKPQKIPKWRIAARGSLNIFVWTKAYSMSPAIRAGMWSKGLGPSARAAAKTRRWRAIARTNSSAAPQNTANTSG